MVRVLNLAQPDQVSCGPTAIVAHQLLSDPDLVVNRAGFIERIDQTHRRLSSVLGPGSRLQLPWPRALGTSPWSAANQLRQVAGGTRYRWRILRRKNLVPTWERLRLRTRRGRRSLLYVGNGLLPRHVVLVVGVRPAGLEVFDPANGHTTVVTRDQFVRHELGLSGWDVPWLVVEPTS